MRIEQNIQLVQLNGNCPDEKLLETGRYTATVATENFYSKRIVDLKN